MRTISRTTTAALAAAALALGAAACGGDDGAATGATAGGDRAAPLSGQLAGAGASSQAAAMEAWTAGFQQRHPDVTIAYDPIGSGGGREQFLAGGVAFAGTDAPLDAEELQQARTRCGDVVELPVYLSPIAIIYNLDGVDELQLSPRTLAHVLAGRIRRWDDPAIARDNPGVDLPDLPITPVHRADESGTTENLAEYLAAAAPDAWPFEVSGDWPVRGGEAADGTSGVVDAVAAGEGTIGYADASQAGDLGIARIRVGDAFVGPTPEAAAAIVAASPRVAGAGRHVFAYELRRDTTAAGTYPIVLVSYVVACTDGASAEQAALVRSFLDYVISAEGQAAAARAAGSAPLADDLRAELQGAVDAIGSRDAR